VRKPDDKLITCSKVRVCLALAFGTPKLVTIVCAKAKGDKLLPKP